MKEIFNDDDTYLARWLSGDLTGKELSEFEKSDEFAAYKKIAESSANLQPPSWNKDNVWQKIQDQEEIQTSSNLKVKSKLNIRWIGYAAAACFLGLLGFFTLFNGDNLETYQTFAAQTQTVELPDGSTAYLNAVSKLSYDSKSFLTERELILDGEAFFEVNKGSTFTVSTTNGDVRVLGTSFNVRARAQSLNVECFTGKVGVSFDDFENEEVLIRGDVLRSNNKLLLDKSTNETIKTRPEWRDGRSRFSNVRFDEVIKELERQFDVKVKIDKAAQEIEQYNGGFEHDDLTMALELVSSSINYDYKIEGKTVILNPRK